MAVSAPKILYFIAGMVATPEQQSEAFNIGGPGVAFRNAALIDPADKPEDCDGVAGPAIPPQYADIPNATERERVVRRMARRNPILAQSLGMTAADMREPGDLAASRAADAPPVARSRAAPAAPAAPQAQGGEGWGTAPAAAVPAPVFAPAPVQPDPPAPQTVAQKRAAAKAAKAAK